MKREDDQELWDLLGKSSAPAMSPFFARNVVRQVRQERSARDSFVAWLRPRLLVPAAAVAVVAAGIAFSLNKPQAPSVVEAVPEAVATLDPQDYEVVADLDNLLAFEEEDSLWEDT